MKMEFRMALTRVINNYAKENNLIEKGQETVITGMIVKESVWWQSFPSSIRIPQYEGQTKTKLGNSEVRKIVSNICR